MAHAIRSVPRCNLLKALLLLVLWLNGCARLPVSGPLPAETTLKRIAAIDAGGIFAPAPAGDRVALARDGLRVVEAATGRETSLAPEAPAAVAWAADGLRLAAAFDRGDESRLLVFGAEGESRGEAVVEGRISGLLFLPDGDILAAAVIMKVFSFGGDHRTVFYRWDGRGEPVGATVHSSTAKPLTLAVRGDALFRTVHLALSPYGDEILYTRFHDPPAFGPYLKVVLRHLSAGAEREVASVTLDSGGALFADETVFYGDGSGRTRRVDPWTETEMEVWNTPGRSLGASASGQYLFIDGRLFRGASEIAVFPADSDGRFAAGGRLYIRHGRSLYLFSGLAADSVPRLAPALRERLLQLRKWRSRDLISHEDYLRRKERILEP
jgi:hypothetical protein